MKLFWNIFQPGDKEKSHATGKAPKSNESLPQLLPEPRAPTFERYPPVAQIEWTFAADSTGQRLRSLWRDVNAGEDQPLASRPSFSLFVIGLRRALQSSGITCTGGVETTAETDGASPLSSGLDTGCAAVRTPALTHNARGIPADVLRGLVEGVLSASVCRCGRDVVVGAKEGSPSAEAVGCPVHGLSAVSWARILPSGRWCDRAEAFPGETPHRSEVGGDGDSGDPPEHCTRVGSDEVARHHPVGNGTARARACLLETLCALSAACQWSHTREELARQGRAGGSGIAQALMLLCDALCTRVTELRRRRQGPFRRSGVPDSAEADCAHQDLVFFARCLAPLTRLVANSAPAAAAWYDLVNAKTLAGTGFPRHPWLSGSDRSDGLGPSCCPVPGVADAIGGGAQGAGSPRRRHDEGGLESPGHANREKEEAIFVCMSSAADSDEWSAMLVGAGLVRSLSDSLQACLDVRIAARGATKESLVAGVDGYPAKAGSSFSSSIGRPQSVSRRLQPLAVEFAPDAVEDAKREKGGATARGTSGYGCLGCDLETAQIGVVIAVGALLSAHPLATRDRFQLAGGMARLHGVISHDPGRPRDDLHTCISSQGEHHGNTSAVAVLPFLPEHCALVALQVLRLCLRADSSPNCVPPDIVGGAARLAGALSIPMLSTWGRCHHSSSALGEGGRRHFQPDRTVDGERSQEHSGDTFCRQGFMSQKVLPLECPEEVAVPEATEGFGFARGNGVGAQAASSSGSHDPAAEPKPSLGSLSYRLCGPREDYSPPTSLPTSAGADWEGDGLHLLARDRGSGAAALVSSVHSRLATSLDISDILVVAQRESRKCPPSVSRGEAGTGAMSSDEDGKPRDCIPSWECPALILMALYGGMLDIVGECDAGTHEGRGSAGAMGSAGMEVQGDAGMAAGVQGAILRSALANMVKIFGEAATQAGSTSAEKGRGVGRNADCLWQGRLERHDVSPRPGEVHPGHQQKPSGSTVSHEGDATVAPFHQLLVLRFLHQAVRRWPRLTVKLTRELGLWDFLFSQRFLSGGSWYISRAAEGWGEAHPHAPTTNGSDALTGVNKDHAIGWGLVRDGTLLLLEAVMIVRCLLQFGREELIQDPPALVGGHADGGHGPGSARSLEIEQFVSFLTSDESSRPCAITALQGCRWLRAVISMESALGPGLLLPSPLRVAILRLAFQWCDHGNDARSDAWVSRKVSWPLVHSSLSLALDLVRASPRGILFETAVAYAVGGGGRSSEEAVGPSGKSRAHRATASMTSEASSPCLHPSSGWWAAGSGGSRTPASVNSLSPRPGRSFSFGDIHAQPPPPPKPPRPLPEVLFKAALDKRARPAVFFITRTLGVEAEKEALVLLDVHHGEDGELWDSEGEEDCISAQEVAAAVISGLVEGYVCLCERAAVATVAGSAASDDGPSLLLDALHGACALVRSGASQRAAVPVSVGATPSNSIGDDAKVVAGGAEVDPSPKQARIGGTGVSPLLQEAFREHWAPARLLVVLDSIVCVPCAPGTSASSPSVPTEFCAEIVTTSLSLFTTMMSSNSLGKLAFRRALSEHYGRENVSSDPGAWSSRGAEWVDGGSSFVALANLVVVVPPASLCHALMEMLMDGQVPACIMQVPHANNVGENGEPSEASLQRGTGHGNGSEGREEDANDWEPPEIRNPFVVPLIFRLLPGWSASQQDIIMRVFRTLLKGLGGGMVNRSLCCDVQPALMDQLLDMLPQLDEGGSEWEDGLQGLAVDLVRHLGSHSVTVAQLKKIFRLLQPLSASSTKRAGITTATTATPLQPPWMCCLLRALRGMMDDDPGPQRLFLLDGVSSGLRLPRMPRWPAQKGYTFFAWVRLEGRPASSSDTATTPVAEAPCLFSFCGAQRGQGVAACFIPLRKKRRSARSEIAAPASLFPPAETPQQYAVELRVGAGRNKPPTIVRFPGAVVTDGEWVFVAVAHAASRWGQRGEASVLVSSCWRTSASPFPRFGDGGVANAFIACHHPRRADTTRESGPGTGDGAGAKVAGRPVLCSLRGQMGPIYLFAGSMSETLLRGIRQLGPGYAFNFEPPQVDSREVALLPTSDPNLQPLSELGAHHPGGVTGSSGDDGGGPHRAQVAAAEAAAAATARQHLHLEALSGALTPRILLAFNPSVWGGEYFLDNTPEHNPVKWTNGGSRASAGSGQAPARQQMMYSMAGSQAHVLIQPPSVSNPAAGGSGVHLARHGHPPGRANRSDAAAGRSRGWSGGSGASGIDGLGGDNGGDRATRVRPHRRPGHMHARRLPGTRECVRRDVRDALDCLGGVKVLLPLFAQYDHGVRRSGASRVSYRTDPRLNETVLALLAGTLRDSIPNRRFLRLHGGLSLLSYFLERVSPQHMSAGALTQACRLTDRLGGWSEEWADSAIESLLSPSRLWVFAPTEAQLTLVGVLRGLTRRCPGRMRRVVGVQRCLDALNLYFWYTPPTNRGDPDDPYSQPSPVRHPAGKGSARGSRRSRGSLGADDGGLAESNGWSYVSRQWVHPSTGEVLGVKASGPVLVEIRARLLDAAIVMACDEDGVSRAEVAAVLGFLQGCRDDSSRCEALRLVLRLIDDPQQAGRFVVASGYVAAEDQRGQEDGDGGEGESPGRGPGRGGTAVALFLSLLRSSDPTVRLLAFLALGQMLITCLRIDDRSRAGEDWSEQDGTIKSSAHRNGSSQSSAATAGSTSFVSSASSQSAALVPPNTSMVEFMGGADAKAEELVVLTGASSSQEKNGDARNADGEQGRNGVSDNDDGSADLLELRGGAWEHIGLPRHRLFDILQWAQRQVIGAEDVAAAGFNSATHSFEESGREQKHGVRLPNSGKSEGRSKRQLDEAAETEAAGRVVAMVTLEVLQGLLIGRLPRGFAARVANSGTQPKEPKIFGVSPAADQPLDPFFTESPVASASGSGELPAPPLHPRSRPRSWRNGQARSTSSAASLPPPLSIRLPEAFPALCQQVATAPLGAAPRAEAVETLIAAVQSHSNAEQILSVDSWQQYLLSVVSSAQGRQAVAAAAAAAFDSRGDDTTPGEWSRVDGTAEEGDTGWYSRRSARDEAAKEERLADRTVRLISWLAMCKARSGAPGRPGAGFAELQDTMSFLRCQEELGTMECMSVGENILRHMVTLLKRQVHCLESEVNGWSRGSHLPSLQPMFGVNGGRHGAAAVLACVWPLASLVVEFIAIPPVANPPAASVVNAPTPSAAALAVLTAAVDGDDGSPSRWSEESLTCPSPMQGILQWLDTGMDVPPVPPSPATSDAFGKSPRMGSFSRDVPTASAAGWRAWDLLDATVDLTAPTGDTLLWDARYRHGLSTEADTLSGPGRGGVYSAGAVDPIAVDVLDWGRRTDGKSDQWTPSRRSAEDRGASGGPVRSGGGGSSGGESGGYRRTWFVDTKSKKENPLADAGGVPWMVVRILLAVFVSGGAAEGHTVAGTPETVPSGQRNGGSNSGKGKGGGGAGVGPPSIALVALQRLIALLNSLESSAYEHFEFEVLHVAARVSAALRTTRLTPQSAWVLGALQLLAKCLATQGSQIEDLLVAAEERLDARANSERSTRASSLSETASEHPPPLSSPPPPPRARLVFSRASKPKFWLWDLLSGGRGAKASRRRRITPKGVLHQIAAETPSLAAVPSADLALETIRRTLGIELPSSDREGPGDKKGGKGGAKAGGSAEAVAAPLTWELLEAAFEHVSEDAAGHEAMGLASRLDRGGMHNLALQVLGRVRALEGRGLEAGIRVPADVLKLGAAVKVMETSRASALSEANIRAASTRQAQWEAVLKQLATERGPWGRGVEALDLDLVYWALSAREDDHGRRLKLMRNPYGSLHTVASERTRGVTRPPPLSLRSSSRVGGGRRAPGKTRLRSGSGSIDFVGLAPNDGASPAGGADQSSMMADLFGRADERLQEFGVRIGSDRGPEVREMSAQTSLWRDLCKYQFKSVRSRKSDAGSGDDTEFTEDEDDEEEDDEFEELETSDADSDGGERSSDAEDHDDDDVGWDGVGRNRNDTISTMFTSTADVVRPFCVTPGIVTVEGQRLVFTRSPDPSATLTLAGVGPEESKRGGDQQVAQDNYRWALRPAPSSSWPTVGLRRVLFRPYGGLRSAALEMWFRGGGADDEGGPEGSLLVGLPSESLANSLHQALRRTRPPALEPFLGRYPATVVKRSKAGTWGASAAGGVGMFVGTHGDRRSGGGGVGTGGGGGGGTRAVAAAAAAAAAETARTPLTQAWMRRRCGVTNFDYLRGLNAAAGRTTADLSRYPVFPWVLSERAWKVKELDLKDERNFRDLAWPMGAQRPEQREVLHMRYAEMERSYLEELNMGGEFAETALPPFHHGTHYSTSAYVLWYLIRLEPFTSLHIHLQDGRFDKADRLFQSLPDTYQSCARNPGDVKEAIPELYYLPELLVNATGFDLGCPQNTEKPLGDVELPPWACGDPWEFVRRHREALESEHVSLRLHQWIDLVFGCRQRPPALNGGGRGAVESCNVFFHLTYPGAVDLPRMREQDPQLYESTMKQIEEFGQAPAQLFKSPHPRRLSIAQAEVVRPLASPVPGSNTEVVVETAILTDTISSAGVVEVGRAPASAAIAPSPPTHNVVSYPRERVSRGSVLLVADLLPWAERLVTVDARRAIGSHGWRALPPDRSPPFRLRPDVVEADDSWEYDGGGNEVKTGSDGPEGAGGGGVGDTTRVRRLGVPFAPDGVVSSRLLEPPPCSPPSGGYDLGGDYGGGFFGRRLGGLGGSYDSLASMGSLLSLPQSAVPPSERLQPFQSSQYQHAAGNASLSPGAPTHDVYNGYHHDHRQNEHERPRSPVPLHASDGAGWDRATGGGGGGGVGGSALGSHLFAVYAEYRLLFSGGHWDSSFRVTALDTGRLVVSIARHRDVVTSLSFADGGVGCRRLITASRDTTLMVWRVDDTDVDVKPPVSPSSLLHVLYGHDAPVTCVCARAELDAIVSSGDDGTLVVHTLWGGEYVRTIAPHGGGSPSSTSASDGPGRRRDKVGEPMGNGGEGQQVDGKDEDEEKGVAKPRRAHGSRVDAGAGARTIGARSSILPRPWPSVAWVGLSAAGYIVAYSPSEAMLRSYTVNGHPLGTVKVGKAIAGPLRAFVFSEDGSVLLSGGHDRVVTLRWAHSLALANDSGREGCGQAILDGAGPSLSGVPGAGSGVKRFGCAVRSLALTAGERHLLVGLEDGTLGVLALDAKYLRQRLRSKLDQLGI